MKTDNSTNVSRLFDEAKRTDCRIIAYRSPSHPKGEKILMNIRYGDPIPASMLCKALNNFVEFVKKSLHFPTSQSARIPQ